MIPATAQIKSDCWQKQCSYFNVNSRVGGKSSDKMDIFQLLECRNLGLIKILQQLSLHDLMVCTRVSKLWRSVIQDNYELLFKEANQKTESKWLNGKLAAAKLDFSRHVDGGKVNLRNMKCLCCSGYSFFIPRILKRDCVQPMMVYCGSTYIKSVTIPNCGINDEVAQDCSDFWIWKFTEMLDYEESFILVAQSRPNSQYDDGGELTKLLIQY